METVPKDGRDVCLLVRHPNYEYAGARDRERWEEQVTAHWIDHNGGGFTWSGLFGYAIGWKPVISEIDGI
jgi:hypothetical protein